MFNGLIDFPLLLQNNAEIIVGFGMVRIDTERRPILPHRLVLSPQLAQSVGQVRVQ
jgi:hypothetical protein